MSKEKGVGDHAKGAKASDGLKITMKGIKQVHSSNDPMAHNASHGGEGTGLARILEPAKNADEFGKGTVGKPSELDAIREDGDQGDMGEETLLYGGGYFEREKVGLEDGVSLREEMVMLFAASTRRLAVTIDHEQEYRALKYPARNERGTI